MNAPINSLLGPLEAAARHGSWENVEDIALAISRLARRERHAELKKIQEALFTAQGRRELKQSLDNPPIVPGGSQVAKTPIPVDSFTLIQWEGRQLSAVEVLEKLKDPAWTAKVKANGWDIEELRKAATKAL